jgi:hypothetical protein
MPPKPQMYFKPSKDKDLDHYLDLKANSTIIFQAEQYSCRHSIGPYKLLQDTNLTVRMTQYLSICPPQGPHAEIDIDQFICWLIEEKIIEEINDERIYIYLGFSNRLPEWYGKIHYKG